MSLPLAILRPPPTRPVLVYAAGVERADALVGDLLAHGNTLRVVASRATPLLEELDREGRIELREGTLNPSDLRGTSYLVVV